MAGKTIINNSFILFPDAEWIDTIKAEEWKLNSFSANNFYSDEERIKLEEKYWPITEITDKFNRQSVSYQLSKKDCLHRWLKYKEGFSSQLVKMLLDEFEVGEGDLVMDPFMGSGTTALVCALRGINSIGYDVLPMSKLSILAKTSVYNYSIIELQQVLEDIKTLEIPDNYTKCTPFLSITSGAYPETESRAIAYYTEYFAESQYSDIAKNLVKLCILNSLEKISYTIKSGQYLGWDHRCPKIIEINRLRVEAGKKPFVNKNDKGVLPTLKEALTLEFAQMVEDVIFLQSKDSAFNATCKYTEGSVLFEIAKVHDNTISGVITSPPYCNRYDYTRTYGLELAYLGVDDNQVKQLRQKLLSCTVESKTKIEMLKRHYVDIGRQDDCEKVLSIVTDNKVLNEIKGALRARNANGEINNKGVLRMVEGYFMELAFLYSELFRVCKPGAHVAFVNDNVRYAGEVIPVDYLSTNIAEQTGFKPVKIYTLRQQKGNSSQQMAKYGRVALRKSITIWEKE
ncbi:MAG: modification methylase [Bacteroidaceae bacterium]|nr:modification methylase [Bacteroidaceae bacterium]